jgi:hypothetical protein
MWCDNKVPGLIVFYMQDYVMEWKQLSYAGWTFLKGVLAFTRRIHLVIYVS